jgi:hypothetical protein
MARRKQQKRMGQCAHCLSEGEVTDDHLPPRNLFPTPLPPGLAVVPACKECNEGASLDDEYFRQILVFSEQAGGHPAAKELQAKVFRALQNPKKRKFKERFLQAMGRVDLFSAGGVYLGPRLGYTVNNDRLNRVATRILTGFFYQRSKRPLPQEYRADAFCLESQTVDATVEQGCETLSGMPPVTTGEGVFPTASSQLATIRMGRCGSSCSSR